MANTTKITIDNSGSQIVHNPAGQTPLPSSAGQAVTTTSRGDRNEIHGQIANTSIVFDNPGRQ